MKATINYTLTTQQRMELYENEARLFERWMSEAADENSREHWRRKVADRLERVRELKGA